VRTIKSILEELYFGNINPNSKQFIRGSDFDRAMQMLATNEEKLTKQLNGEEKLLFCEFSNAQSEINSITAIENFIDGFRLGAKIMMEIMGDENGCLRDII
jgi:hypothetical protein